MEDVFPTVDSGDPVARRKALAEYRQKHVSPILLEQDLADWQARIAADPGLQWPLPYAALSHEPFLAETVLDPDQYSRADYLEWVRLRCGGPDFGDSPSARQRRHFAHQPGGCPFGCTHHADAPGPFFLQCPGIAAARRHWSGAVRIAAPGLASSSDERELLGGLLSTPQDAELFEHHLRYVGWAMRTRRAAASRREAALGEEASSGSEDDGALPPDAEESDSQ